MICLFTLGIVLIFVCFYIILVLRKSKKDKYQEEESSSDNITIELINNSEVSELPSTVLNV